MGGVTGPASLSRRREGRRAVMVGKSSQQQEE